jgi:Skp family chaperone for outer membrane proteins
MRQLKSQGLLILAAAVVCSLWILSPAESQPTPAATARIGVVNVRSLFDGSTRAEDWKEQILKGLSEARKELVLMEQDRNQKLQQIKGMDADSPSRRDIQREVELIEARWEWKDERLRREYAAQHAAATNALYREAQGIIAEIAKSKGLQMVVKLDNANPNGRVTSAIIEHHISTRGILYAENELDVTQEVLDALNAAYAARKAEGKGPEFDPAK